MWRRGGALALRTLARKNPNPQPRSHQPHHSKILASSFHFSSLFSFSSDDKTDKAEKPAVTVEDINPIATGHEREEIEYALQGKKRFDMDAPSGPFGTKEAPATVHSRFDKRIVGCAGGLDDAEHDVIWFWLDKDKPFECPICGQYFQLKVVGPGGVPGGYPDELDEH